MSGTDGDDVALTIRTQDVATCDIRVEEPPIGRRDLWRAIATPGTRNDFDSLLSRALIDLVEDSARPAAKLVEEHDVTAVEETPDAGEGSQSTYVYALRASKAIRHGRATFWEFVRLTRQLGGQTSLDQRTSLEDVRSGPLQIFAQSSVTPSVVINLRGLERHFNDYPSTQRKRFLEMVVDVAKAMDVTLVCSPLVRDRLLAAHRDDLPAAAVQSAEQSRRSRGPTIDEETEELAREVRTDLAPTPESTPSIKWVILVALFRSGSEELPYHELYSDPRLDVENSTVRGHLLDLEDRGVVDLVDVGGSKRARLTRAGSTAVVGADDGAVRSVARSPRPAGGGESDNTGQTCPDVDADDATDVDHPPKPHGGAVSSQRDRSGAEDRERDAAAEAEVATAGGSSSPSGSTERLSWDRHHAAVSASESRHIALCDAPVDRFDLPSDRAFNYDPDREEVVVAVEADDLMAKTAVRLCAALTSDLMFNQVLTQERLDDGGVDLGGFRVRNPYVLQKGPCMGYLAFEDAHGAGLRRRLREERQEILEATSYLRDENGDLRPDVAEEILRRCHGLLGTVTHILDQLDIDLVRVLRVPEYRRNWMNKAAAQGLVTFLAKAVPIASKYGLYNAHRILYEPDEEAREDALGAPRVDDPHGEHIGGWVLRGNGISDLEGDLRRRLDEPLPLQEDGENFAEFRVPIDVKQAWRREAIANVASRLGAMKSLQETRTIVSVLQAFLGSLRDASTALYRLGEEKKDPGREMDLADLRWGLSCLEPERILPDVGAANSSTASKVVHALLAADAPLSTSALADEAGVSTQSVRDNAELLEALGLAECEDQGKGKATLWRLKFTFTSERAGEPVVPDPVPDGETASVSDFAGAVENALRAFGVEVLDDRELWETLWPGGAGADPVEVAEAVDERCPELLPWLEVVLALQGHEVGRQGVVDNAALWATGPFESTSAFGADPPTRQVSLEASIPQKE